MVGHFSRRASAAAVVALLLGLSVPIPLHAQTTQPPPETPPSDPPTGPRSNLPPVNQRAIVPRPPAGPGVPRPDNPQAVKPETREGVLPERPPRDENSNR